MTHTTAVIVDDEPDGCETLTNLLHRQHNDVALLGTAANVEDGVALLHRTRPSLLFLDVELGERTGFELLEALGDECPHVIFTTAHEGYAVRAIRFSALDFLLKPIVPDELKATMERARSVMQDPQLAERLMALTRNILPLINNHKRIALPVAEGLEIVDTDNILYCESSSNYTLVHQCGTKPLLITRTLKEFEDLLPDQAFIRVHHSYLINVHHVKKYIRGEGGELIMSDGANVAVSRRKKQELMDALARM